MYTPIIFDTKIKWISFLLLGLMIASVISTPMYYKKTDDDTYEPDLVPVSSTVIPLYEYHVNATGATKHHALTLDDEYRIAYLKHMHKKHKEAADEPDTLITLTKKYHPGKTIKTESQQVAAVVNAA